MKQFAILVCSLLLFGCSSSGSGDPDKTSQIPADEGTPYSESPFTQHAVHTHLPVDILFVIDSSSDMDIKREKFAYTLNRFMDELINVDNYTVAFILGWMSPGPTTDYAGSGRLFSVGTHPPVLASLTMTRSEMVVALSETFIAAPPRDPIADEGESGMYALNQFVTNYSAEAKAAGFLRDGAGLAVIFLADENDICAVYPDGVKPLPDPQGQEEPARKQYCQDFTAQMLVDNVQQSKGSDPTQIDGIVFTNNNTLPFKDEREIGYGYLDAIDASGGTAIDLGDLEYKLRWSPAIGNAVNSMISQLQRKFTLTQANVNPNSIEVLVDGVSVGFRYLKDENAVFVEYAGHDASVVQINYRVLDKPI